MQIPMELCHVTSRGGIEQCLRGGTYSMVYAVARQLCQYDRPIVTQEVSLRSERAMRAQIDSTNSNNTCIPSLVAAPRSQ